MTSQLEILKPFLQEVPLDYQRQSELVELVAAEREKLISITDFSLGKHPFSLVELTHDTVEEIRVRFAGKRSPLQSWLKSLRLLPAEDRKEAGALINRLKTEIEQGLSAFLSQWQNALEEHRLSLESEDIDLPLPKVGAGARHPVTVVMRDLMMSFRRMGFIVVDGPEIDTNFYNFDALNVVADHPAREMQDTFFLASEWVLRTHTSNVQSHALCERGAPLKIVCPGCVYRNEHDISHLPSFRQIECLVVDKGIHMGHLRSVVNELLNAAFGRVVQVRFRASYFPFTEPSAEVDVSCQQCFGSGCRSCKHTGWSEIGGCGLVNKKVLAHCGIDASLYSGIAFGFGVDRIAKDRFQIADLRSFTSGDVRFLQSFASGR